MSLYIRLSFFRIFINGVIILKSFRTGSGNSIEDKYFLHHSALSLPENYDKKLMCMLYKCHKSVTIYVHICIQISKIAYKI